MKTILLVLFFGFDGNITFVTEQLNSEKECLSFKSEFNNFEYDEKEFSGVTISCVSKGELIEELGK